MKRNLISRIFVSGMLFVLLILAVIYVAKTNEISLFMTGDKNSNKNDDVQLDEGFLSTNPIDEILKFSTAEFIGGYPIDDSFLLYIANNYGEDILNQIVANAQFKNPQEWYDLTGKSIHVLWHDYCKLTGIRYYALDNTYAIEPNGEDFIMDFTGDITFADEVGTTVYMDSQINGLQDCIKPEVINELKSADITMVNNEFAYTTRGEAIPGKAYTLRAPSGRAELLFELGADIAGLANNHVFDFGEEGLLDTLSTLDELGMPHVGAGYNLEDASRPVYYIVNGRKIAVVAATQIERTYNYTREATAEQSGVLKTLHDEYFCGVIKNAKACSDLVIVFIHWGTEGNSNYGTDQSALARDFIEAGADAIVGGHTHCLQAVEYMDDVPIYYSLGNFFFTPTMNVPEHYDTGIAQLRINSDNEIKAYFIPCSFDNGVLSLVEDEDEKARILGQLWRLSIAANVDTITGYVFKK